MYDRPKRQRVQNSRRLKTTFSATRAYTVKCGLSALALLLVSFMVGCAEDMEEKKVAERIVTEELADEAEIQGPPKVLRQDVIWTGRNNDENLVWMVLNEIELNIMGEVHRRCMLTSFYKLAGFPGWDREWGVLMPWAEGCLGHDTYSATFAQLKSDPEPFRTWVICGGTSKEHLERCIHAHEAGTVDSHLVKSGQSRHTGLGQSVSMSQAEKNECLIFVQLQLQLATANQRLYSTEYAREEFVKAVRADRGQECLDYALQQGVFN